MMNTFIHQRDNTGKIKKLFLYLMEKNEFFRKFENINKSSNF